MQVIGLLLAVIIFTPINALIQAATFSKLWEWFVAGQYGHGPTYSTWYGISLILGTIVSTTIVNARVTTKDGDGTASSIIAIYMGTWIGFAVVLAISWVAGALIGWV